ncbi:unnamed protein product [Linum trigynum]|uniref:Uncharacterized protein n=1 Tax=Linum trigynum TaxID=586398 RepID=A0AAV2F6Z3_9ROSI
MVSSDLVKEVKSLTGLMDEGEKKGNMLTGEVSNFALCREEYFVGYYLHRKPSQEFQYKLTFGKIGGAYLRLEDWRLYGETGGVVNEEEERNKQSKIRGKGKLLGGERL